MKLGREVGLGLGHIVLDGDPPSSPQRGTPPNFGPCLLWPNGRPSQLLLSTCFFANVFTLNKQVAQLSQRDRAPP